jgi:hypothetical protein
MEMIQNNMLIIIFPIWPVSKLISILIFGVYKSKIKAKLSLCLIKHHAMNTYWGVEV